MSMATYPLISKKAFLVDDAVAAHIRLAMDKATGEVPKGIASLSDHEFAEAARNGTLPLIDGAPYATTDDAKEYLDSDDLLGSDVFYATGFDGTAEYLHVADKQTDFDDDLIVWVEPKKEADYFASPYSCEDDIIAEYKELFKRYEFSEYFDWEAHIVDICGTYFG